MDATEVNRHVEGAAGAHQRLLAALDPPEGRLLTDEMVGRASRLASWTVGHVLAHIAHNADSMTRMFEGAEAGRVDDQYPGGMIQRDGDIERDAARSAAAHVAAIRDSVYRLEGAWNRSREAWMGSGRLGSGVVVPVADLPLRRWREVEVHMSDLGIGELSLDGFEIWSNDYVRHDLRVLTMRFKSRGSMGLVDLPAAVLRLEPCDRLAWLLGRVTVEGVEPAGVL